VEAELHYADQLHAVVSVGNVFINLVRKPATVGMIRETRRQVQRHFRRWNNQCVAVSVLEPSAAQSVPREVRDESAALTAEFQSLAAATVIEGSGFRAAATRTAVSGMFLISRPSYPHKVFGNLADGASWVIEKVSRTAPLAVTSDDILRAIEVARAAVKP
jgi:hypothetical protein